MFKKLGAYNKTVIAVYLGVVSWITAVVVSPPAKVTASEWVSLLGIGSIILGVNRIQNDTPAPVADPQPAAKVVDVPPPIGTGV